MRISSKIFSRDLLSIFLFTAVLSVRSIGTASEDQSKELGIPSEELKAKAVNSSVVMGDISRAFADRELKTGDELTLFAVLKEDDQRSESLISLRWTGERANNSTKSVKRFASTGHVFEYESTEYTARALTIGEIGKEPNQEVPCKVNLDFLQMGFFDSAKFYYDLDVKRKSEPNLPHFWFFTNRSKPVDKATVEKQKILMDQLGVDDSSLRTLAARGVSSDSFLNTLNSTKGVSDILWSIARKPSAFSMLRGGIKTSDKMGTISKIDPSDYGLPTNLECYKYPIELSMNGKQAVNLELLVTKPMGPIQQTAGIFGLDAYATDGSDKKLTIRLVGAKTN